MSEFNAFQKKVAEVYGDGDFAYITTTEEAERCGDTLFVFLIRELATDEDCLDRQTAISRVQTAITDLNGVLTALCRMA